MDTCLFSLILPLLQLQSVNNWEASLTITSFYEQGAEIIEEDSDDQTGARSARL